MAIKPLLVPTSDNTYIIEHPEQKGKGYQYDFGQTLARSLLCEQEGDIEEACNLRFEGFQRLAELMPEQEEIVLDWDNDDSRSAMELLHGSGIDHFLMCDFEMATAMMEMLLELDPEDHLEATKQLSFCYIALEEYELFDEVINDISDKYPEKSILKLWSEHRRSGSLPLGEITYIKRSNPALFKEFTSEQHPTDNAFVADIESRNPSKQAVARELWLQTEHLWTMYPQFIEDMKKC